MTRTPQHSDIYNRAAAWWGDVLLPDAPDATRVKFQICLADIIRQNMQKRGSGDGALGVSGGVPGLVLALGERPDPLLASALRAVAASFPAPRSDRDRLEMWLDGRHAWICSGYRAPPRPL